MEKWRDKVALVTGASSGIGAATAKKLVEHGVKVVGCGRNFDVLSSFANELNAKGAGEMFPVECDVKKESDILDLFKKIIEREAVKLMDKTKVDDGHIVIMNSTSGHAVDNRPEAHFYQITKFAVTAMAEGLRRELVSRNSHVRVTSISPGLVGTDFQRRWLPEDPNRVAQIHSQFIELTADDIADNVIYVLSTLPRVNICEVIVRPTEQLT